MAITGWEVRIGGGGIEAERGGFTTGGKGEDTAGWEVETVEEKSGGGGGRF